MSQTIQLLTAGLAGAINLRWAFDPALGFPDGGFDVYRRRAQGWRWYSLPYAALGKGGTPTVPLEGHGYEIKAPTTSGTGAALSIGLAGGQAALVWSGGEVGFAVNPAAGRIAVWVGHSSTTATPPARIPRLTFRRGVPNLGAPILGSTPLHPGQPIILRAISPSGTEVKQIDPPFDSPQRVEFSSSGVTEVHIDGLRVFVTAWEIGLPIGNSPWGAPLNGGVPIRLPRSDTPANLVADVTTRVGNAGLTTLFGSPMDQVAVDELRRLIDTCQPDPAQLPGPQWLATTAPDGTTTQVDALGFLLLLALRPLVAQVAGLYWLDDTAQPGEAYDYRVEGHWGAGAPPWARIGTAADEDLNVTTATDRTPAAISSLTAVPDQMAIAHPLSPAVRPIYVPVASAKLSWSVPARVGGALIDYGPVLYLVDRQALGLLVPPQTNPPLPSPSDWLTINSDAPTFVSLTATGAAVEPMYRDRSDDPTAPLEGWYAYRVRGVNVFEQESPSSPTAIALLLDHIAPPSPTGLAGPIAAVEVGDSVTVSWSWGPDQALSGPDAATFRVYLQELTPTLLPLTTGASTIDALGGRSTTLVVGSLPVNAATALPGAQLEVDDRTYLIVSVVLGANQALVVALSNGQAPLVGRPASITTIAQPSSDWIDRVATINVPDLIPGALTGAALAAGHLTATISPAAARAAALHGATVYDRASGVAFVVQSPANSAGTVELVPPPGFNAASTLPNGDALVFPRVSVTIPSPFAAGSALRYAYIAVTAADGRPYQPDRLTAGMLAGISGNESAPSLPVPMVVIDPAPPPAPGGGTDPNGPDIYATPPDFYSRSYYKVEWTAVAGLRYQVLRALDETVFAADRARGASRAYQDAQYPTLTNAQLAGLADQFTDIFTIRTPVPVAANSFIDELPGSGPNRFIYRVAGVSSAGVRGPLSAAFAPVHIPDTIPPSRPVPKNATVDDDVVFLRWTQPNDRLVNRFRIFRTTEEAEIVDTRLMGAPREVVLAALTKIDGAFVLEDTDVVDGLRYWYRIAAIRDVAQPITVALESPPSLPISVKAFSSSAPEPPTTSSTWNPVSREVTFSWGQVSNLAVYVQRSYDEMRWQTIHAAPAGVTSYVDDLSGDSSRTVAYYRLRVTTANGRSNTSDALPVSLV